MVTTGQQNPHENRRQLHCNIGHGSYLRVITLVEDALSWQKSTTQTIPDQIKLGQVHFKVYPTDQLVKYIDLDIGSSATHEIMPQKVYRDQTDVACPTK